MDKKDIEIQKEIFQSILFRNLERERAEKTIRSLNGKLCQYTKNEMIAMITSSLGGRAAEELFLGDVTTGASDDFKRSTNLARSMVTEYGMSDLGPIRYEQNTSENVFLGRDYNKTKNY